MQKDKNIINISVIYRRTAMWEESYADSLGLSQAMIPVLASICKNNGILQNELVKCLNMDKGTVTKNVLKLEENDFIRREGVTGDKRAYYLVPTEKASDIYPIIVKNGITWFEHLTKGMTLEERKQFEILLDIAAKNSLKTVEVLENENKTNEISR